MGSGSSAEDKRERPINEKRQARALRLETLRLSGGL